MSPALVAAVRNTSGATGANRVARANLRRLETVRARGCSGCGMARTVWGMDGPGGGRASLLPGPFLLARPKATRGSSLYRTGLVNAFHCTPTFLIPYAIARRCRRQEIGIPPTDRFALASPNE